MVCPATHPRLGHHRPHGTLIITIVIFIIIIIIIILFLLLLLLFYSLHSSSFVIPSPPCLSLLRQPCCLDLDLQTNILWLNALSSLQVSLYFHRPRHRPHHLHLQRFCTNTLLQLTASATQTMSSQIRFCTLSPFTLTRTYTSFCADQFLPRHGFSGTTLAPTISYTNQLLFFFELTRRNQKQPGGRQNAEELLFFPLYFRPFFSGTQDIQTAGPLFVTVSSL